jgi:all-trans-retinol dehydrogenase (NAD+)
MSKIKNSTVLITGGGLGLGKLTAERCLQKGAKSVILWDINEDNLNKTTAEFAAKGYDNVFPYIVDVSDAGDVFRSADDVLKTVGVVDILFNNAGIVVGKPFVEHTIKDIERSIGINVLGCMYVARAFMPAMLQKGKGHLINIASAAGMVANPNMSVYASSKWAVLGWSESVRLEMEALRSEIKVLTVTPSYINTGMFSGVKAPMLTPILDPEFAVRRILQAVEDNEIMLRTPFMVNAIPVLKGVLPVRAFDFIAGNVFGVYKTMDKFEGRAPELAVPDKRQ